MRKTGSQEYLSIRSLCFAWYGWFGIKEGSKRVPRQIEPASCFPVCWERNTIPLYNAAWKMKVNELFGETSLYAAIDQKDVNAVIYSSVELKLR